MDKRELILEATLKLVLEGGFYHLNMKKVAKESGVAAGTIYLYFASKDQLISDLYLEVVKWYIDAVMSGYSPDRELGESLRAMMHNYLHFYLKRPDCFSFLVQYSLAPFVFKEKEQRQLISRPLFELVERAREAGVVKDLPPIILVSLVSGTIAEIVRLWQADVVDLRQPHLQRQVLETCWEGIVRK